MIMGRILIEQFGNNYYSLRKKDSEPRQQRRILCDLDELGQLHSDIDALFMKINEETEPEQPEERVSRERNDGEYTQQDVYNDIYEDEMRFKRSE
jgi:NADH:ubiquinone oxidoreductase subunit